MIRLKPYAARGIASPSDPFRTARTRLSLLYILIIIAIVGVLSSSVYEFHAHDIGRLGRHVSDGEQGAYSADEIPGLGEYLERLGRSIIFADIVTILVGGGLSWLLASRTLRPIRKAVQEEQRFFADAAHDLRTPLAVMRSEAEVALRSDTMDVAEARRIIASSLEEIQRMSTMVEQMLGLARDGKAGTASPATLSRIDLAALAVAAATKMTRRAQDKGIDVSTAAAQPVFVNGDTFSLERALYNVLDNALVYTPSGGRIAVRVIRRAGQAVLEVEDTGIGIPPDDLPHITEPFYRGDRARSTHSGGAGLGLTIAATTMQEHGGRFTATSGSGGTTISLTFPAA
jgi:signal transduction histidine kinase